jgi:hypothetical protein
MLDVGRLPPSGDEETQTPTVIAAELADSSLAISTLSGREIRAGSLMKSGRHV